MWSASLLARRNYDCGLGYFLSISSISVPSGSSMKAMVGPPGLRVYGSSVIVTLFFRSVSMVFWMFWTVNARWSKMRFS